MLPAISSCTISIAVDFVLTLKKQVCNRVSTDAFAEA